MPIWRGVKMRVITILTLLTGFALGCWNQESEEPIQKATICKSGAQSSKSTEVQAPEPSPPLDPPTDPETAGKIEELVRHMKADETLSDPDPVIEALVKIGDPRAVDAIIAGLDDIELRSDAAEALGRIGGPRAVDALIPYLEDPEMKWDAAEALGMIGDPRAVGPLLRVIENPRTGLQSEVIEALGKIGDPAAIPHLIKALEDPSKYIRWDVEEALGKMGKPAVPSLVEALHHSLPHVREHAANALGAIADPEAVEPLISLLKGKDERLRWEAAEALGKIGSLTAVEPLIIALKDRWCWYAAAEALGRIGDKRAVGPLIDAFERDTDNFDGPQTIPEALTSLTGQNFEGPEEWKNWFHGPRAK
jgi:HEAT repeat protein